MASQLGNCSSTTSTDAASRPSTRPARPLAFAVRRAASGLDLEKAGAWLSGASRQAATTSLPQHQALPFLDTMAVGESSRSSSSGRVKEAQDLAKSDPQKAEAILKEITSQASAAASDAATREYEAALISLGELYRDERYAA